MGVEGLIESTKNSRATAESIKEFEERLRKREEVFAEEAKVTKGFYDRYYGV